VSAAPTVFLFDVDGTLIRTQGAGKRALVRAMTELVGAPAAFDSTDFRGMTDLALLRAGMSVAGREFEPRVVESLVQLYMQRLEEEIEAAHGYAVLPGVRALLDALTARSVGGQAIALGLGTGNFERGARIKLARGALNSYFAFGGFGEDAEDRTALLRAGALRGAALLGVPLGACAVWVIGDTPKDVSAAHGIGGRCLAVATGGHPADELVDCGADVVVETLADPRAGRALEV
jgi:phosphoglycolate phosphatase-like HAD superfamily hydrolase